MFKKCSSISLFDKSFIVSIYFAFFIVQLHYQFTSFSNSFFDGYSGVITRSLSNKRVVTKAEDKKPFSLKTIRLNKRYNPENCIDLISNNSETLRFYPSALQFFLWQARATYDKFLFIAFLRGPPSLA